MMAGIGSEQLSEEGKTRQLGRDLFAYLAYVPLVLAATQVYVHLLGGYYHFFDIGINDAANSWGLFFIDMPVSFAVFLASADILFIALRRLGCHSRKASAWGMLGVPVAAVALFLYETGVRLAGYPKDPIVAGAGFWGFLAYSWKHLTPIHLNGTFWLTLTIGSVYALFFGLTLWGILAGLWLLLRRLARRVFRRTPTPEKQV